MVACNRLAVQYSSPMRGLGLGTPDERADANALLGRLMTYPKLQDGSRISLDQTWEIRYWRDHFGITEERLKQAVAAVGNETSAVREHLTSMKARTAPRRAK